jgi:coiled-coil domain-containing protein 77
LEKLEGLRINQEEYHRLQWELRRRNDEINELQSALSESNISINQERKQIIYMNNELDNYKCILYVNIVRSKEDRRRLSQLLELAEPIEQTIKLYYDRRPEKLEKFNRSDYDSIALSKSQRPMSTKSTTDMRRNSSKSKTSSKLRIPPSDEKQQIVRTVLFPNHELNNAQNEENEYLRKQLVELKNFYEIQIMRMEEDRRLREEEIRLHILNNKDKEDELIKKNQKLEKLNYELTKDYMQLKYDSSNNERKLYEELELIKLQNEALSVSLREITSKTVMDKEINKNDYERKTKEITNIMRNQVKANEENINIIKEQYKQIQKIYTNRVKELEDKVKALTDKYNALDNKRNYELEGYLNEINMIRRRVKSYEEYVYKLRRMAQANANNLSDINSEMKPNSDEFYEETSKFRVYNVYSRRI